MGLLFEWFVLGAALIVWYRHWTRIPRRVTHSPTPHRLARPVPAQPHWWARLWEEWGTVRGPSAMRQKLVRLATQAGSVTFERDRYVAVRDMTPVNTPVVERDSPPVPPIDPVPVVATVPEPTIESLSESKEKLILIALDKGLSANQIAGLMGGTRSVVLAQIRTLREQHTSAEKMALAA